MRLLIVGPRIDDIKDVRNFSGVWAYYLAREFAKRGVALRYSPQLKNTPAAEIVRHYDALDLSGVDHVLALGVGYFDRIPQECIASLKQRCAGLITQTHDRPSANRSVDLTFGIRQPRKNAGRYQWIGWAADPDLCRPRQIASRCQILIDHPDYGDRITDRTPSVTKSVLEFSTAYPGKNIVVRRIADHGVVDCLDTNVPTYTRAHQPYAAMCAEYGRADIFMVTHPESVGLTALECAMAGALIVAPVSFIATDLLSTIRHVSYVRDVPWAKVTRDLNVSSSRARAMGNTWEAVADRILKRLPC
jgi:hypothetical protein